MMDDKTLTAYIKDAMDKINQGSLFDNAKKALDNSYSPYSRFPVGCAIVDENGKIHVGCNVENVSYPASLCAERAAIARMISQGGRKCTMVMVVSKSDKPTFPCGFCLQVLREFGENIVVIAMNYSGKNYETSTIKELYPEAFTELS